MHFRTWQVEYTEGMNRNAYPSDVSHDAPRFSHDCQGEILKFWTKPELRFEQDNATNAAPVSAEFCLDAGFGTYENIALLSEMGY